MQVFNFTLSNGDNAVIISQSWSRSNAWGHTANLMYNGIEIATARARYYNRTWESYQYQSVNAWAVSNAIEERRRRCLSDYKDKTGKKRLTAETKRQIFAADPFLSSLSELYGKI